MRNPRRSGRSARRVGVDRALLTVFSAVVLAISAAVHAVAGTAVDPPAPSRWTLGLGQPAPGATAVVAAGNHLTAHRDRYGLRLDELKPIGTTTSVEDGATVETVRFGQRHGGIPVLGGQYLVHLRRAGATERIATGAGGRYFDALTVPTTPAVTEQTAKDRAQAFVLAGLAPSTVPAGDRRDAGTEVTSHGLVVIPRGAGILTYHLTVRGTDRARSRPVLREVYVDAAAGFPVLAYDRLAQGTVPGTGETLRGRTVPLTAEQRATGDFRLVDGVRRSSTWDASGYDVSQVTGWWPDGLAEIASPTSHFAGAATSTGAVDAHTATARVLDYYRSRFGRSGLDGKGGEVRSLVGVTMFGQPYVNAFWDGGKMVYGGGDDEYYPLSADLDVVGHEMTHGVIEHSANLLYLNQSGAMNEAIADYFGNAIDIEVSGTKMSDPDAGLLGEDLCRTRKPRECALRNLNDGATMTGDFTGVTTEWDNGGVHLNSTIFSGALWDIRERLGGTIADRLVYKALTQYLTPLDDFADGREAVLAAARSMRLGWLQQLVVRVAFDARGIRAGWEHRIGVDSSVLLAGVTTTATGSAAAGGWWVTSNSSTDGSQPYAVYAGRTGSHRAPARLSPDDGRYHVYPHTDGTTAAWAAYGPSDVKIMTRRLAGGPATVLATIGYPLLNLRVGGDTVAFQINHVTGTDVLLMKPGWSGPQFVDGGSYRIQTFFPDLSGGKVSYIKRWFDATGNHVAAAVLDLGSGTETLMPELPGGAGAPVMTSRYVVWPVDTDGDQTDISVYRAGLDGTGLRRLVDENGSGPSLMSRLDATDTAVTFDHWPGGELTNRNLPKLYQVPLDGGASRRVSCNRGAQTWFAADTGSRVVWHDGTLGRTDLVTRSRPAHRC